jgi:hypothetical protein
VLQIALRRKTEIHFRLKPQADFHPLPDAPTPDLSLNKDRSTTAVQEDIIMLVLWLLFMGLFIVALALPLAQRFAYAFGQWGSLRATLEGMAGLVLVGVLFSAFLGLIGLGMMGTGGLMGFALIGEIFSLLVLALLGTFNAVRSTPAHSHYNHYVSNLSE